MNPLPCIRHARMLFVLLLGLMACISPASAQLAPNGNVSGALNGTTTTQLTYTFTANADGNVTFTLDPDSSLRSYLRFLDSNGTTVLFASALPGMGQDATLTVDHLAPGATYYVRAIRYDGAGSFTLSNVYTAQSITNDTEPNNTSATGLAFAMPGTRTGHIGYSRASYNDLDTADWYAVTVPYDGNLQLTLTQTAASRTYIRFYDANGTTHVESSSLSSAGGSISLTVEHLAPGTTYYVMVDHYTGYGGYTLTGAMTGVPPQTNDIEPNNSAGQAALTFPLASGIQGHIGYSRTSYGDIDPEDWYKVTVPRDCNLTFTLTQTTASRVYLRFYDADSTTHILSSGLSTVGGSISLTIPHLAPGATYYLRIDRYSGYGGYTVTAGLTSPAANNDNEPNNSGAEASATLPIDGEVNGHIGYSRANYSDLDQDDWYLVEVPHDGNIDLTLSFESPARGYVRFYDADGTTQVGAGGLSAAGGTTSLAIPHLAPGTTYFVRVDLYDGYGGYTLSNRFSPMYPPNDVETNDNAATATAVASLTKVVGHIGYSRANYASLDTNDWYSFAHAGGNFSVTLQNFDTSRAYLELYNSDGTTRRASSALPGFGGVATLAVTNLPAGSYYLRVVRYDGYGAYGLNAAATVMVSGNIELEDCVGDAQPVIVEFRKTDGSLQSAFNLNSGSFSFSGLPRQNYNVYVKGAKWLSRLVFVQSEVGDASGVNILLKAGDADDSNSVDVFDLDILIGAFDSVEGDPNWNNGAADFNCDGSVDVFDLDLLIRNFDKEGEG